MIGIKKILLVIDIQKGFVSTAEGNRIKEKINEMIDGGYFDCVIATKYQNYPKSSIIKFIGWNKMMTTEEQGLVEGIKENSDYIVNKRFYSAINDDMLQVFFEIFDDIFTECVFIVGVDTECCVLTTAVNLFEFGIRPIILSNYCFSTGGEEYHQSGVKVLERLIGRNNVYKGDISSSEDLDVIYKKAAGLEKDNLKTDN